MSKVMMKKNLARALMDACMEDIGEQQPQKLGLGGVVKSISSPLSSVAGGAASLVSSVANPILNQLSPANPFTATNPMVVQQLQTLQGQQSDIYNQQQNFAQTLLAQAQGQGPNPALAQFNQATGQNIAGQAALTASARGASANPALIARQVAMQGGNIQQSAVGQAAIMQAQQQLAAQQALQAQQTQMANQALQGQGIYMGAQNQANAINAQTAMGNQQARNQMFGSLLNAGGSAAGLGKADGGMIDGPVTSPMNDEKNDTVPTLLSPGEGVIDKETLADPGPIGNMARTVLSVIEAKNTLGKFLADNPKGYGGVLNARKKADSSKMAFGGYTSVMDTVDAPEEPTSGESIWDRIKGLASSEGRSKLFNESTAAKNGMVAVEAGNFKGLTNAASAITNPMLQDITASDAQMPQAQLNTETSQTPPAGEVMAPQMSQPSSGMPDVTGIQNQMLSGIQGEANALAKQEKGKAEIWNEHLKSAESQAKYYEAELKKTQGSVDQISQDIATSKIDPNKYWSERSTGGKIGTILGVMLSGIGAGLQGGGARNMAWDALQRAIEQDIDAQKANLGKKQSMLSDNLKIMGSLEAAEQATRLQSMAIVEGKMAKLASESSNPLLQAQAQQKMAEVRSKMVPLQQSLAQNQAQQMMRAQTVQAVRAGGATPELVINNLIPENDRDQATKELGELKGIKANIARVGTIMDEIFSASRAGNRITSPIQSKQILDTAQAQLLPVMKQITGEKMSDADARIMLEPYVSGVLTSEETKNKKTRDLQDALMSRASAVTPTLDRYSQQFGIDLKGIKAPEREEIKTMNGQQYKKVKGGWQKVG